MAGRWHLLHPAVVHFPLALLLVGGAARACALSRRAPAWMESAAAWLLWLGSACAWVALGLGYLAENTANHVPAAWKALDAHEDMAWWTAGWFAALSIAVFWLGRHRWRWRYGRTAVLAAWLAGLGLLLRTAYLGGELVFRYGMGVGSAGEAVDEPLDQ